MLFKIRIIKTVYICVKSLARRITPLFPRHQKEKGSCSKQKETKLVDKQFVVDYNSRPPLAQN